MLIIYIFITSVVVSALPKLLKFENKISALNLLLAFIGSLMGAFLGFGDAQFLLENPFLNERTLMVVFALLFVFSKILLKSYIFPK